MKIEAIRTGLLLGAMAMLIVACGATPTDPGNRLGQRDDGGCHAVAASGVAGQFAALCDVVTRSRFVGWDYDESIEIVDASSGAPLDTVVLNTVEKGQLLPKRAGLEYSPDGRVLAAVSGTGRLYLLDAIALVPTRVDIGGYATAMAFGEGKGTLAVAFDNRESADGDFPGFEAWVEVFEAPDYRQRKRIDISTDAPVTSIAIAPGGALAAVPVATPASGPEVSIVELASGAVVGGLAQGKDVMSLAFSADGQRLFVLGSELVAWDLASYEAVATRLAMPGIWAFMQSETASEPNYILGPSPCIKRSPDGTRIAVSDIEHRINLFDADTLAPLGSAQGTEVFGSATMSPELSAIMMEVVAPYPRDIAWLPDGETLVAASGRWGLSVLTPAD